jgi:hypothetical protein
MVQAILDFIALLYIILLTDGPLILVKVDMTENNWCYANEIFAVA